MSGLIIKYLLMNHLPAKLVTLRKHYNYSQSYVADYLDVDVLEYMAYENGSKMIDYVQTKRLASLYHASVKEIFMNSEEVTLHETDATTDDINLEYFTREATFKDKIVQFVEKNKLATGIIGFLSAMIIILLIVVANMSKPYTPIRDDIHRLSASDTTVIYIDDEGRVLGSGSNANGELSNLSYDSAIKVCEGEGFTIILNENGTIDCAGLTDKMEKEVRSWDNIVDVDAGAAHVLAVDSNGRVYCAGDSEACEISGTRNIQRVFATKEGSIVEDNNGQLNYSGSFIGSSSIRNYMNIISLDSSDNNLAILGSDHMIHVYSKTGDNFFEAEQWEEIVDVACGDDFVAGLDTYGKVHIEIQNDEIRSEIANWSNIIAIAAGKDYLVAFDGKNIYGVGNNAYNQFVKEVISKQTLEKVSNVSYTISRTDIAIQFDGVPNASGYLVSINVGTGLSKRVETPEVVRFDTQNMTEGKNYVISIVSVGSGDYKDSDTYEISFTFERPEETFTIDPSRYVGQSPDVFFDYVESLGGDIDRIRGTEDEEQYCEGESETVISSSIDGQTMSKSELSGTDIEYTYCRVAP